MSWETSARSSILAVALTFSVGAPAAAQLCTGLPFDGGRLQPFGRAATIQGERTVGAGLGIGTPAAFGRLSAARTSAWDREQPGLELRAGGGVAYAGGPRHAVRVCIIGALALATGPHDVPMLDASGNARRMDLSATEWSLGVSAGAARPAIGRPQVFPAGSFVIIGAATRAKDRLSGEVHSDRSVFGLIEAGV
ncbi:MAG TPA: hypothetical protein VFO82_12175, partial [Steroidobacteraceae bacterium]|nr:hypothetical protein [Steroidobacteraceae bacterium]